MKRLLLSTAALAALAIVGAGPAQAGTIIAPTGVTVNVGGQAGGPGPGSPWAAQNMINQTGLNKTYVSGVTDFDAFIASNPIHNTGAYSEWNSETPITSARITFDFGAEVTLGELALWDEDASSLSLLRLSTPDAANFGAFQVVDTVPGRSYGAQVFRFSPITTRYLTFDLSGCHQGGLYNHAGCGIGEVAFGTAAVSAVPEPATWAMMILGLGGVGATLRARRRVGLAAA